MINHEYKKVLMLSYFFPPIAGSSSIRSVKMAKYAKFFGWKPYVITPKSKLEPLDSSLVVADDIVVHEVFSAAPVNLKYRLESNYANLSSFSYGFLSALLSVYSFFYNPLCLIDRYEGWLVFAFWKSLKVMLGQKIDLIYVRGYPASSFVLGYALKKIFWKKPLIIDYDESWSTLSIHKRSIGKLRRKMLRFLEYRILKKADKVICARETIIREIRDNFLDIEKEKIYFIPNGYDPLDFYDIKKEPNAKFTVTYVGAFSETGCYSPETFFSALSELIAEEKINKDEISFIFAGKISKSYQERYYNWVDSLQLNDVVRHAGFVTHRQALEYIRKSDILLFIIESLAGEVVSKSFAGNLPTKLFEYIYSEIPIFGIVPDGAEADLILKTKTGIVTTANDVESVKDGLYKLYLRYKEKGLKLEQDWGRIEHYDRKVLTHKLVEIFNSTLQK